jgi:hypothetical protein
MAEKSAEDRLKDKFHRLRDKWIKEVNAAANEKRRVCGELNSALKDKLSVILRDVTKLGVSKDGWMLAIKQAIHYEHGDAVVEKAAEKDVDVFGDFAKVALALHADLPLFGNDVIKDLEAAIVAKMEAEEAAEKMAREQAQTEVFDGSEFEEDERTAAKVGIPEDDEIEAASVH